MNFPHDENLENKRLKEEENLEPSNNIDGAYFIRDDRFIPNFDDAVQKFLDSVRGIKPRKIK